MATNNRQDTLKIEIEKAEMARQEAIRLSNIADEARWAALDSNIPKIDAAAAQVEPETPAAEPELGVLADIKATIDLEKIRRSDAFEARVVAEAEIKLEKDSPNYVAEFRAAEVKQDNVRSVQRVEYMALNRQYGEANKEMAAEKKNGNSISGLSARVDSLRNQVAALNESHGRVNDAFAKKTSEFSQKLNVLQSEVRAGLSAPYAAHKQDEAVTRGTLNELKAATQAEIADRVSKLSDHELEAVGTAAFNDLYHKSERTEEEREAIAQEQRDDRREEMSQFLGVPEDFSARDNNKVFDEKIDAAEVAEAKTEDLIAKANVATDVLIDLVQVRKDLLVDTARQQTLVEKLGTETDRRQTLPAAEQAEIAKRANTLKSDPAALDSEQEMLKSMSVLDEQKHLQRLPDSHLKILSEAADKKLSHLRQLNPNAKQQIIDQAMLVDSLRSELTRRLRVEQSQAPAKAVTKTVAPAAAPVQSAEAAQTRALKMEMLDLQQESNLKYERWSDARDVVVRLEKNSGTKADVAAARETKDALWEKLNANFDRQSEVRRELGQGRTTSEIVSAKASEKDNLTQLADQIRSGKTEGEYRVSTTDLRAIREIESAKLDQLKEGFKTHQPDDLSRLQDQTELLATVDLALADRASENTVESTPESGYVRTAQDDVIDDLKRELKSAWGPGGIGDRTSGVGDREAILKRHSAAMEGYKGNNPAYQLHGALLKEQTLKFKQEWANKKLYNEADYGGAKDTEKLRTELADLKIQRAENQGLIAALNGREDAKAAEKIREQAKPMAEPEVKAEVSEPKIEPIEAAKKAVEKTEEKADASKQYHANETETETEFASTKTIYPTRQKPGQVEAKPAVKPEVKPEAKPAPNQGQRSSNEAGLRKIQAQMNDRAQARAQETAQAAQLRAQQERDAGKGLGM